MSDPGEPEDPGREPVVLRPRFRHQLVEVAIGAPIVGATLAFLLRFITGVDSNTFVVVSGILAAVLFVALYLVRFQVSAPREVRLDEDGVTVRDRHETRTIRWDAITGARHRSRNGLRWEWTGGDDREEEPFILRDDGFSVSDWTAICTTAYARLRARGIAVETDRFGKFFEE